MAQPEVIKKDMGTILKEIEGKIPFYTPEWTFKDETDVGVALSRIFAYMSEVAIKKLNDAPQRHFLSFLETINASLIPARPARVPLTFLLSKGTPENVLIPALTQAAGQAPDGKPVIFETEKNIVATPSKPVSLLSVIKEDEIFDHTVAIDGRGSSEFFGGSENLQEHVLYIGDKNLLNVKKAIITIDGEGSEKLADPRYLTWEYGSEVIEIENGRELKKTTWKQLVQSNQTGSLQIIKNTEDPISELQINGLKSRWIRCRVNNLKCNSDSPDLCDPDPKIKNLKNIKISSLTVSAAPAAGQIPSVKIVQGIGDNFYKILAEPDDKTDKIRTVDELLKLSPEKLAEKLKCSKTRAINILEAANKAFFDKTGYKEQDRTTSGIAADLTFSNDVSVDPTAEILPFGSKPQIYNTFYIACDDAFSKKGYAIDINFNLTPGRPSEQSPAKDGIGQILNSPQLSWEYWDGNAWSRLENLEFGTTPKNWADNQACDGSSNNENTTNTTGSGIKTGKVTTEPVQKITIPSIPEVKLTNVNGKEKYWIRVRLVGGDYGKEYKIIGDNRVEPGTFCPPKLRNLKINYLKTNGEQPEYILAKNNLAFKNCKDELKVKNSFKPFEQVQDINPTLYFGFDRALKGGPISLFISIDESIEYSESTRPRLKWQYLSRNKEWAKPDVLDETNGLTKSGMVQFVISGEMVSERMFGEEDLYWIRAVVIEKSLKPEISLTKELMYIPPKARILGLYHNSTWALQSMTVTDEIIGGSTGERSQAFRLMNKPVLKETIWVNEVSTLTEMERKALKNTRKSEEKKDDKGNVTEFWVKWDEVSDFLDSGSKDRHYVIDRTTGGFRFGDGVHGMIPSIGTNNIKVAYSTGGGKSGNLAALNISKLQSTIAFVDKAYNPVASDGGADTEEVDALIRRAPAVLKHRKRAVALEDYQKLAKEASEKVARVKVLPNSNAKGEQKVGNVTIVIVPESPDARPVPTPELRHIVERYLRERCSNLATISVIQPSYIMVKISAVLATNDIDTIPVIEQKARSRVIEFLHPLYGGVEGKGWDFGSVPCISDIFSLLENIENVDYVRKLTIQLYEENGSKITGITKSSDMMKLPEHTLLFSGEHDISAQWVTKRE